MKIVQSYWSKPTLTDDGHVDTKFSGGWPHIKYHYMSWALSCLQFKKYYNEVELVTDEAGQQLFIEELKLPYSKVHVVLDNLNDYSTKLWPLGKLYAFQIPETPFIHADGDVFIWKRFDNMLEHSPLIAQNPENNIYHYKPAFEDVLTHCRAIPEVLMKDYEFNQHIIRSFNAGILGGSDLDFFKDFTRIAIDFVMNNTNVLHKQEFIGARFAIIYEQYLFAAMAREKGVEVSCLFKDMGENFLTKISDPFNRYKSKQAYFHTMDYTKMLFSRCFQIERFLKHEYATYHSLIMKKIKSLPKETS